MPLKIRVSTKAVNFEERKQQHIQLGYRIEDERPIPVNGLCSFMAVKEDPHTDVLDRTDSLPGAPYSYRPMTNK